MGTYPDSTTNMFRSYKIYLSISIYLYYIHSINYNAFEVLHVSSSESFSTESSICHSLDDSAFKTLSLKINCYCIEFLIDFYNKNVSFHKFFLHVSVLSTFLQVSSLVHFSSYGVIPPIFLRASLFEHLSIWKGFEIVVIIIIIVLN